MLPWRSSMPDTPPAVSGFGFTAAAGDRTRRLSGEWRHGRTRGGDRDLDGPDAAVSRGQQMTDWSLSVLLAGLHDDIQRKLETVRQSFGHPTTKGDASEIDQRCQVHEVFGIDSCRDRCCCRGMDVVPAQIPGRALLIVEISLAATISPSVWGAAWRNAAKRAANSGPAGEAASGARMASRSSNIPSSKSLQPGIAKRSIAVAWALATTSSNFESSSPTRRRSADRSRGTVPGLCACASASCSIVSRSLARSFAASPAPINSGRSTALSPSLSRIWPLLLMLRTYGGEATRCCWKPH